jgi:CheY-like chemotaxis protein
MSYVLIVDNDEMMRVVIAGQLHDAGITTQEAVNGHDALQKAKQDHPAVIILDEHMPEMNGQQFVEALQREPWFHEIRIVVFTALNDVELMNHKILAGVSDYLDKANASPEMVVQIVQKYLQPQQ